MLEVVVGFESIILMHFLFYFFVDLLMKDARVKQRSWTLLCGIKREKKEKEIKVPLNKLWVIKNVK